ncbi:uncharacterized protein LACBIDRAFT_316900 [Laccaria bicolor S238N-H82]|uniref:Predicted protein n=1 Tax=Laccaria bicolor (strain S238N-H82 / ATCC MYA-4686) TaxID=486041 RepID=B0D583_LACBS|nr:uncharacterized protein LACBIDRAFT_316900 [Laccaria bicolor S238N-H82]EDR10234.1 predicted protein [Laccaria bicolor S238N-H82]|eukprot:XP_001878684.1 predicted protein [Laccaria bicolor S238N-H82]
MSMADSEEKWRASSSTDSLPSYPSSLEDGPESDPLISASDCSDNSDNRNDSRPSRGGLRTTLIIHRIVLILTFILLIGGFIFFIGGLVSAIIHYPASQVHWLALESSKHCEGYGARKYWAKMGPLPDRGWLDPMETCWALENEIRGRKMKPTYCEDKGADRGVYGHWIVDFDEGACQPFWEGVTNKGCTAPGSGLRRFDAHLINLDYADGWKVMCSSTPADFNGLHFNGAMSCAKRVDGVFGTWEIVDGGCL